MRRGGGAGDDALDSGATLAFTDMATFYYYFIKQIYYLTDLTDQNFIWLILFRTIVQQTFQN